MDRVIEYVCEVLPDGQLSVPEEVRQELAAAAPHTQVQVTMRLLQPTPEQEHSAWETLRRMGQDAGSGRLSRCVYSA